MMHSTQEEKYRYGTFTKNGLFEKILHKISDAIYKIFENCSLLLAHLAKGQLSLWDGAASVVHQLFPLNNFFSKTTRLISTKFDRKHL